MTGKMSAPERFRTGRGQNTPFQRKRNAALNARGSALHLRHASIESQQLRQAPWPPFVNAIFASSVAPLKAGEIWLNGTIRTMGTAMGKIDFRKALKQLYMPSAKEFSMVDVPPMRYLMIDGCGNPNTSEDYQNAIEALYSVAYTLKFTSKKELGKDYVVLPLEGLWWADDMSAFTRGKKDQWHWTMMIMQPEWITPAMIAKAIEAVRAKKPVPGLSLLRHELLTEGRSVQIMHVGSYDEEAPVLARLHHEYLPQHKLTCNGKHHEIYIGDPRKTAPGKLKTVLRQPVKDGLTG